MPQRSLLSRVHCSIINSYATVQVPLVNKQIEKMDFLQQYHSVKKGEGRKDNTTKNTDLR